jgi:hypothetical protein
VLEWSDFRVVRSYLHEVHKVNAWKGDPPACSNPSEFRLNLTNYNASN